MKAEKPIFIAASLLMASFVLDSFVKMYALPASESAMISWIAWICGMAGIIMFFSAILTQSKR
ncbi:MAG TPA: hypothetical protein VNM40_03180 [Candidatus Paceibacterota bacterium]|nr:hypothetical protein [Candidatus Paceibacterota bacterium]